MLKNKPLKLIIDTNLWVSFIISNKQNLLDPFLFNKEARLLFSAELIKEIQETIAKPRLKKYFKTNALEEMLSTFEPFIDLIEVESHVTVCRDPKDNFLLALAKDGKADYLLTGDKDLLDLIKFSRQKSKQSPHPLTKQKTTANNRQNIIFNHSKNKISRIVKVNGFPLCLSPLASQIKWQTNTF